MKHVVAGLAIAAFGVPLAAQDTMPNDTLIARATRIVKHLEAGRFDSATTLFDPTMREKLPASRLRETWTGLTAAVGNPLDVGAASLIGEGVARTVTIPIRFGMVTIGAAFTFDAAGLAKSLAMRPAS